MPILGSRVSPSHPVEWFDTKECIDNAKLVGEAKF